MIQKIKSKFAKNVLTLMTGNISAQIVMIGASPILTRLYSPEVFGVFALFGAIVSLSDKLTTFSYERAIVLPPQKKDALSIFLLCIIILFIMSFLSFFLTGSELLDRQIENREIVKWFGLIPLAIFLFGCTKILRFWLLREKKFTAISCARAGNAVFSSLFKIGFAFWIGTTCAGLIGGLFAGLIISICISVSNIPVKKMCKDLRSITKSDILKVATAYSKFPLYATWNAILKMVSAQLIIYMFTIYYSSAIVGFYSLGNRILRQPIVFISESIQNAYFQKSADDLNHGRILAISFFRLIGFLVVTGVVPFGILFFWGEFIFSFAFGKEWHMAGVYAKWLSPWFFMVFISTPSNVAYEVLYKQDLKSVLNLANLAICFCAIYFGHKIFADDLTTLKIFSGVNVFLEMVSILICSRLISQQQLMTRKV